ncbi:MAG: S1 family peptidase [Candidatus Methanoperedens sp.]
MKQIKGLQLGAMLAAMLLVSIALIVVVNAQGQDSGVKSALDNKDSPLYDVQIYASNNNISTEEALRRFQLQDIAGELNAELSMNETETFAGLWIEHKPKFKIVVQFTLNGEETIKPYMKQHAELANIVEVRTANVSLADLQRDQNNVTDSVSALGIPVQSGINVYENSVKLYLAKSSQKQFNDALQQRKLQLPDKIKVDLVEGLAEDYANIYGGLSLSYCTSGFSVKQGWIFITKGITTAGHCDNTQSYSGTNLPFQSENWAGSYDIQWHTAPGYTVTNKINLGSGSTRDITAKKSRSSQVVGNYVCKYGVTTGYTCGYISDTSYNPRTLQNNVSTFILVDNTAGWSTLAGPGDSGGPWFANNDAYGTLKGGFTSGPNAGDAVYMAVDYLESGLGVSVMTSP